MRLRAPFSMPPSVTFGTIYRRQAYPKLCFVLDQKYFSPYTAPKVENQLAKKKWGQGGDKLEATEKALTENIRKGLDFLEPAKRIELFTC